MTYALSRRALIASLLSGAATVAGGAPLASLRPEARPTRETVIARSSLESVIENSNFSGATSVALSTLKDATILERFAGSTSLPPASVTKTFTCFYALETLGAEFVFETAILVSGPIVDGVVDGDLILVGGGDPTLVTDDLAAMADALSESGVKLIKGQFKVWAGALPQIFEIDPSQMDHLGYNPSIGGLNLNFNRVYFEWAQAGTDYTVSMDARSERYRPTIQVAQMSVVERDLPIYTYSNANSRDEWSVAKRALGDKGSRWLPVRYPALYAAEAFRSLAGAVGISLPAPRVMEAEPAGQAIVVHRSEPLEKIAKECLKFSTNITAEVLGLTATLRHRSEAPNSLAQSAQTMSDWIASRTGVKATFVDHSGLGDETRVSADEMVAFLATQGVYDRLGPILKTVRMRDGKGNIIEKADAEVHAKTGTLNFVSALAGYIEKKGREPLVFATFVADMDKRAAAKSLQEETPRGASTWSGQARRLEHTLLRRWALD